MPAQERSCPGWVACQERIHDLTVFAHQRLDTSLVVINVVFTKLTKLILLFNRLRNETVSRHDRQYLVELGIGIEYFSAVQLAVPRADEHLLVSIAAACHRLLIQHKGRLHQACRLNDNAKAIAGGIRCRGIEAGHKNPAMPGAPPDKAVMRHLCEGTDKLSARHVVSSHEARLGELFWNSIAHAIHGNPVVQRHIWRRCYG